VARFQVGVQLEPQHCSIDDLRRAWREADDLGVDSIWTWDHFFPLWGGDPDGSHFEGWSLLAAMACETSRASIGVLVTGSSYRNPDLVADMARTVDHLSGGRVILGIGAGWCERDYREYDYEFGTTRERLRALDRSLARVQARLARLNPPPIGRLPVMIGGEGEKVTLRLAARHADMWNGFGPPENFARKNQILTTWCVQVGRDPATIQRTVLLNQPGDADRLEEFLEAGGQHLIVPCGAPFDLGPAKRLLEAATQA
jgi:probable F420-dependent oxidoreductase